MDAFWEVTFTLAEAEAAARSRPPGTVCVVFDVLRATSSIVTALAAGAAGIRPVADVAEALAARRQDAAVLLAGERDGERIPAALAGGVEFDLGNSPREFTPERVRARRLVMTTTNGTRALRACAGADCVLAGAFLNLSAVVRAVRQLAPARLQLVCSGTQEGAALEDALAAGAVVDALAAGRAPAVLGDGALLAWSVHRALGGDLPAALERSRNGRCLLARPALREDVAFCARRDVYDVVPVLAGGWLRPWSGLEA